MTSTLDQMEYHQSQNTYSMHIVVKYASTLGTYTACRHLYTKELVVQSKFLKIETTYFLSELSQDYIFNFCFPELHEL